MFDPSASLRFVGLLMTLLRHMLACAPWRRGRAAPVRFVRCLARAEAELAANIRAALADRGMAAPRLSDEDLIVWFNTNHPCSDHRAPARLRARTAPNTTSLITTLAAPVSAFSLARSAQHRAESARAGCARAPPVSISTVKNHHRLGPRQARPLALA